jgi:hypothetical protein
VVLSDTLLWRDREEVGDKEFDRIRELTDKLRVIASPGTIENARRVGVALEAMRQFLLSNADNQSRVESGKWPLYWAYAEVNHRFVSGARKELGLKPLPMPPALRSYVRERRARAFYGFLGYCWARTPPFDQ